MLVRPLINITEQEFADAVATIEAEFKPRGVVRIRFNLGEDWDGDPAMYFRVVVTDEAATVRERIGEFEFVGIGNLGQEILQAIDDRIAPYEYGMFAHLNVRTESEQAQSGDPEWE